MRHEAKERRSIVTCEIKHYPDCEKPYGMWVNDEYVGDFKTIQDAVQYYERLLKGEREGA